jgi:hypothetical protein
MADFYPAITGRWSGRRVRVALVVDRRQESVRQTAKVGDLDYADLLASSSLSGPRTCVVE